MHEGITKHSVKRIFRRSILICEMISLLVFLVCAALIFVVGEPERLHAQLGMISCILAAIYLRMMLFWLES